MLRVNDLNIGDRLTDNAIVGSFGIDLLRGKPRLVDEPHFPFHPGDSREHSLVLVKAGQLAELAETILDTEIGQIGESIDAEFLKAQQADSLDTLKASVRTSLKMQKEAQNRAAQRREHRRPQQGRQTQGYQCRNFQPLR